MPKFIGHYMTLILTACIVHAIEFVANCLALIRLSRRLASWLRMHISEPNVEALKKIILAVIQNSLSLLLELVIGAFITYFAIMLIVSQIHEGRKTWWSIFIAKGNVEALNWSLYVRLFVVFFALSLFVVWYLKRCSPSAKETFLLRNNKQEGYCRAMLEASKLLDNQTTNVRFALICTALANFLGMKLAASFLGTLLGNAIYYHLQGPDPRSVVVHVFMLASATLFPIALIETWVPRAERVRVSD